MRPARGILALVVTIVASTQAHALSPEAEAGRSMIGVCNACHAPELDPPKGPPLFGVQRRYKRAYPDRDAFTGRMVAFVRQPARGDAIMLQAVNQLGLMAPMPLPESTLRSIAAYIYEERFDPPCKHWEIAVRRVTEKGDTDHARKRQLQRFCR